MNMQGDGAVMAQWRGGDVQQARGGIDAALQYAAHFLNLVDEWKE